LNKKSTLRGSTPAGKEGLGKYERPGKGHTEIRTK